MRKYKQLKHAVQLQKQLDHKYGARRFHAAFIMALFFCLFFTSCSNDSPTASTSSSTQTSTSIGQSQSGNTTLTITRTGQSASVNQIAPPNDHLHRIYNVYFAKKKVLGTEVFFEPIDSAHPQRDGQNNLITYDSILGKTVYLVLETQNLTPNEQIRVEIQSESLTGNTNALEVMYFNASRQYTSAQTLTAVVGNFDALNNNTGSCPYTNLAGHSHRAIIKLQLRPSTRAIFDEWATRLGTANGTVQVRVQRNRGNCAYGNSNRETSDGSTFLSAAEQQFRVVNRSLYCIYHRDNTFNFHSSIQNTRKKIGEVKSYYTLNNQNVNTQKTAYYFYDANDNETLLYEFERNTHGMIEFPESGNGFRRYGIIDAGGQSANPNEVVGHGDHYLKPWTVAALLGTIQEIYEQRWRIDFGDMSSENGSDPWQQGQSHHGGHGHLGRRSGLDIDFRYLDVNGRSFQGDRRSYSNFDRNKNATIYQIAFEYGFRSNYATGLAEFAGVNSSVQNHYDHGHWGFNIDFIHTTI
ncbi:hypothetical protein [Gilliamella intestini]|uniref:Uncharacterized protein n=1 Tax=Gilliamella intestini TaxID=1798183 RepID=A0A1C4DHJ5_9GAMM|nr:hypothetical protein [Gilliamella intestini]SCC30798.1 hypothetical protein GA0061080_10745 [Gilliamella intestini]